MFACFLYYARQVPNLPGTSPHMCVRYSFRLAFRRRCSFNPRQVGSCSKEVRQLGRPSRSKRLAERLWGDACRPFDATSRLLAEAGLLARFHGGVRVPGSTTENIAYRQRQLPERGAPNSALRESRWRKAVPQRLLR